MSMKKVIRCTICVLYVFLLLIIQTTVLDSVRIFGVMPNLLLTATICVSLLTEDYRGLIFGVACGLLLDITGGRMIGINSLLCTYVSFGVIWICDKLYNNNEIVAAIFTFVITFIYCLVFYIFNFLIWGQGDILYALLRKILPEMLYNTVLAIFVYPLSKFIIRGSSKRRRKKRETYI